MGFKVNIKTICKTTTIVVVCVLFSCKPKKPQESETSFLLWDYKDFYETEWIALKDTYLKSGTYPETAVDEFDTRKNCKIPAQAYLRLLVDGRKSNKLDEHKAVCAKGYQGKKPFEIRLRKGERMPPDQINCDHRGLFQNPLNHLNPYQYAYSENFGRVIRLKVKDKDANGKAINTPAYIKRAPYSVEAIKPVCAKYYSLPDKERNDLRRFLGRNDLSNLEKRLELEKIDIDPSGFYTNSCSEDKIFFVALV